ncbi:hypothetical protein [Saccharopolyspora sp. NPDC002376]
MARFTAIKWAREVPTLLHNRRVDRLGHHVLLLMATYAKNDGSDVFVSSETLAEEAHAPLREVEAALDRLLAADLIREEHASNGAPGWSLNVSTRFEGDSVLEDRLKRRRAADAERQRRRRERAKAKRHGEVDRDVTQDSSVTNEGVTQELGVSHGEVDRDKADVTHKLGVSHARVTVTPAGQIGCNSLQLPKDELPKELPATPDTDVSGQANLIEFPSGRSKDTKRTSKRAEYTPDFEAFWAAYGRKGGKRAAAIEWHKALERADTDTITAAVQPYVDATPELKYRKDAERWLKNDCWESAVPQRKAAAGDYQPYRNPADTSIYEGEL